MLTGILADQARHTVAIELDHKLGLHLHKFLEHKPNITIKERDILKLNLNELLNQIKIQPIHPSIHLSIYRRLLSPACPKTNSITLTSPLDFYTNRNWAYLKQPMGNDQLIAQKQLALPHKVFANIPFAIGGQIVCQRLNSSNPPRDCYLVTDARLAYRLSGF